MKTHVTHTRVRYGETDASGIAYYNSYFLYFELGRVEMFRELGLPYDERLPIRETHCRYHGSAKFDDLLEIRSFVEQVRTKGFQIGCRIYRVPPGQEPELLVEGNTVMVTVDADGQPQPLPEPFRRAFEGEGGSSPV